MTAERRARRCGACPSRCAGWERSVRLWLLGPGAQAPLTITHCVHSAAETFFTISMAGSIFFSVSADAARPRVLLVPGAGPGAVPRDGSADRPAGRSRPRRAPGDHDRQLPAARRARCRCSPEHLRDRCCCSRSRSGSSWWRRRTRSLATRSCPRSSMTSRTWSPPTRACRARRRSPVPSPPRSPWRSTRSVPHPRRSGWPLCSTSPVPSPGGGCAPSPGPCRLSTSMPRSSWSAPMCRAPCGT